jgi:hypothetical protein
VTNPDIDPHLTEDQRDALRELFGINPRQRDWIYVNLARRVYAGSDYLGYMDFYPSGNGPVYIDRRMSPHDGLVIDPYGQVHREREART